MAAGVPQLVHPICFDQADNGARVRRLGVGDTLRAGRSTGRKIARALSAVMTEGVREKCRQLRPRLNGTDALTKAAELLERLAGRRA
jgi:rhamnosyltransferase subunit B